MRRSLIVLSLLASLVGFTSRVRAEDSTKPSVDPEAVERFEKVIRPILANRCQECHGETKQKGGLRLDSRSSILTGGNSGPAVVPGKPDESLLVDAINHGELVQMPPKSKLPAAEIESLTTWVRSGAPWGYESTRAAAVPVAATSKRMEDGPSELVKQRADRWSFRPVTKPLPPPAAADFREWARNGIDRFILESLRLKGLKPAREAEKRVLLRRLTFDLIGLPPTPEEIDRFVADSAPDAYERAVDRLLADPRYGERWARHWLDLVRYADTAGHEFDYNTLNSYRYRDYVIRALNADLPYNRFVTEQLAGDLIREPRRHPTERTNESILGTGFFYLGEGTHSPLDAREEEMRRVDNQIDVLSKTFLGLTVSCARCHDHKFDPITTRDYYALAGFLKSSRHQQAFLDPPDRIAAKARRLRDAKKSIRAMLLEAIPALPPQLADSLFVSLETKPRDASDTSAGTTEAKPAKTNADHTQVFESFDGKRLEGWQFSGDAFGDGSTGTGEFRLEFPTGSPRINDSVLRPVGPGLVHSGLVSDRLQGVLRSPSFTIRKRYLHILTAGKQGRINIVVDRFEKIRDPIYGALTFTVDGPETREPRWITRDLSMWTGHSAYIELADGSAADYTGGQTRQNPGDGFLSVDEIVLSDQAAPPRAATPSLTAIPLGPVLESLERARSPLHDRLSAALTEYRAGQADIPVPAYGLAITDGTPEDEFVLIRGNPKNPGPLVPRRILEVLGGLKSSRPSSGSGRLELAEKIVDPRNPLTARVMVNRLWKHHFGVSLVKTVDDFGAMGQAPSHPELLDWLAQEFVAKEWSIKAMHRLIATASTYRMSSVPEAEAERIDPSNLHLHRMNVRRLEGEAIRDTLIAIASGLNGTMYGEPVPVHLTEFMEGRGRPTNPGPLDGDRRRSIYLGVRRNFLNPMFLAFDTPSPFSTMGRRNVSNVPAQALTLLNDPLILEQARNWSRRLLQEKDRPATQRIETLFQSAFGRSPTAEEAAASLSFLASREPASRTGGSPKQDVRSEQAWTDLCHVLINVKEFIYVE